MLPFIRWVIMFYHLNPAERSLTLQARPTTRPSSISFPVARILQVQMIVSILLAIHFIWIRDIFPYGVITSLVFTTMAILKLPKRV